MLVLDGGRSSSRPTSSGSPTSLDALYEAELPGDASNEVIARARGIRHGKLRLTVARRGGPL